MSTHIALFRGMNVGGHGVVRMKDLAAAFVAAGCGEVRTYIQSGNVIFELADARLAAMRKRLQPALDELMGREALALWRTHADLAALVARAPFAKVEQEAGAKLYVSFLAAEPARKPRLPLAFAKDGVEWIGLRGLDACCVSRPVKGKYGFPNALIEKALAVQATTRNWSVVRALAERSAPGGG